MEQVAQVEVELFERLHRHRHAESLLSVPGFGPLLAADFIAATGTLAGCDSAEKLAGLAGLASVPRDSGRITGNLHRLQRYDRRLLRACFMAAQVAARCHPASRVYYERKRSAGR
ncbi:transposase [Xylanimonas ulmi]|uniref:transposase n=1 Tax=Xylanimonas ulmi TaxID=228973 RepID=UPI00102B36A8